MADPALGAAPLRSNQLAIYQSARQQVDFAEAVQVPVLLRYGPDDRRVTRLARQLLRAANWPAIGPDPAVAVFSSQYYVSFPHERVIYVPAVEASSLLGCPDLLHELAHLLYATDGAALVGTFPSAIAAHFAAERQRAVAGQRPPQYVPSYDMAEADWQSRWLEELVCDLVAAYAVGSPYAWQHLRLTIGRGGDPFSPGFGEQASHPADAARLAVLLKLIEKLGGVAEAQELERVWREYLPLAGATAPVDFDLCYPPTLLDQLADTVIDRCHTAGARPFTGAVANDDPYVLLAEAWRKFRADPSGYRTWEEAELGALWARLGA